MDNQELFVSTFCTILKWSWICYICITAVLSGVLLILSRLGNTTSNIDIETNDFCWSVCAIFLTFAEFPVWGFILGLVAISTARDHIVKNLKK